MKCCVQIWSDFTRLIADRMAVKTCCVENCSSSSTRPEDNGVTYHKFPKSPTLKNLWINVTKCRLIDSPIYYVCSRHFCKSDFQKNKDSKYVLMSDAVPSIFPWTLKMDAQESTEMETTEAEDKANTSANSKSSEENLDAIKKFIEEHAIEIDIKDNQIKEDIPVEKDRLTVKDSRDISLDEDLNVIVEDNDVIVKDQDINKLEDKLSSDEDTMSIASNVMDMILNETENIVDGKKKDEKCNKPVVLNAKDKGNNSMALSVGSKVEVRDFGDEWYPAEIAELDYDELEVLIRYDDEYKKHDEWINVSSPRLRPYTGTTPRPPPPSAPKAEEQPEELEEIKQEPIEVKPDEKVSSKPLFVEGERCLARWRDNRRFIATILKDMGDGKYEIVFDDGFHWTCSISRLHKWKPTGKGDALSVDTSQSPATGPQSPIHYGSGPSAVPNPAFHTHLFDPKIDYLSSKSERREMKRKLNIKEIFNIGQKKQKTQKPKEPEKEVSSTDKRPKVQKSETAKGTVMKKPRILKRSLKLKKNNAGVATEIKTEIPDAVASIIGTVKEEPETKKESVKNERDGVSNTNFQVKDENFPNADSNMEEQKSEGDQSYSDTVMEEEDMLKKFDDPNDEHVEVIDKIKEVISKLEDGINESLKMGSPKVERVGTPKLELPKVEVPKQAKVTSSKQKVETPKQAKVETPKPVKVETPKQAKIEQPKPAKIESNKEVVTPKVPKLEIHKLEETPKVPKSETLEPENNQSEINLGVPKPDNEDIEIITVNPDDKNIEELSDVLKDPQVGKVKELTQIKPKKDPSKVKKGKKLRLLQEKKVKKQVEKVKCELEEMKRQFEEMRQQMLMKTQELSQNQDPNCTVMPESFLLPGEWCCKWVNGQPVGKVSEIEAEPKLDTNNKPALPRRSVQVEDKRLPPGWTKHMVRRSVGNSAGKWDVVLVSPANKRFHTKTDMRNYLEANPDAGLREYEHALMDFGVHLKLARRMGWILNTPDGVAEAPATILPAGTTSSVSPLVKRNKLAIKKIKKEKRRPIKLKLHRGLHSQNYNSELMNPDVGEVEAIPPENVEPLEDGYVYVGSMKVQVIDTFLRCPAEGCLKNFRNSTLLQMHMKHYHRELRKRLGATPDVLQLASARSKRPDRKPAMSRPRAVPSSSTHAPAPAPSAAPTPATTLPPAPTTPLSLGGEEVVSGPVGARLQDSPKLRDALAARPVKRPRVLLPVKREEEVPPLGDELPVLDFEAAISTHTVTKPVDIEKQHALARLSEDEDWFTMNEDELDTRSSFPRSGTPDSKLMDGKMAPMSSESANEDQKDSNLYTYTETGERVKIVHMKREEIINCHCGFREEDGLMVQCELCLCWQHALCHNILKESDVPDKYTCSICLNPRRGRRSKRFLHDQERMYAGVICGSAPCDALRRSHELAGNLLRLQDALHALRVKYYVATKKDHPKLYLWAKDWEQAEITYTQEKLNSDYSDLNIMINGMDKENMPMKPDDVNMQLDMRSPPSEEHEDRYNPQRDLQLGSQSLLSGLLSSPGGASLDLPISTSELERLAKSVQEASTDWQRVTAPQPEAAIENEACRERLMKHIQRCQALIDTRLDSIEAQVAELESQDPSFGENHETAEFYPRTKQTIEMLMRDLDTMEELGNIT